jgi:hypothetical protein
MPKSPAELDREIAEALSSKKGARSHSPKVDAYKQGLLEDTIEAVYNRKGSEDLTLAEACEAVREMLPSGGWSRNEVSDKMISATIKRQIHDWF